MNMLIELANGTTIYHKVMHFFSVLQEMGIFTLSDKSKQYCSLSKRIVLRAQQATTLFLLSVFHLLQNERYLY